MQAYCSQDKKSLPYIDLTPYISSSKLKELDEYLHNVTSINLQSKDKDTIVPSTSDLSVGLFTAKGYKHGDAINLTERDTSSWCADAFTAYTSKDDFKVCRGHRGDPKTWRPNENASLLPGVVDFIADALLGNKLCLESDTEETICPIFEQTGKTSIIWNAPNSKGVEHSDIEFNDLVSEFVWIRPISSNKKFYICDPDNNEKHFVEKSASVIWFDDHLLHNIEPVDDISQYSIRVDGRFTPKIRELICKQGIFGKQGDCRKGGLCAVLRSQQNGPTFLQEYNEPPDYSDYDDDTDDDQ